MRYVSARYTIACLSLHLVLAGCATNFDLIREAAQGHTSTVHAMLARGADANALDRDGKTALMMAAFEGHTPTVDVLLGNGVQVNARDREGSTALMLAAARGHSEIVDRLLDKGAEVNTQNGAGQTALMFAVTAGHANIIQALRAKGADLELKNRAGQTAHTLAQARGITHLLEQPAAPRVVSSNEVASLLDQVEKRALEKEQLKRELERQKAQGQGQLRVADNTPPPRITLQQPAHAQGTRGLIVSESDFRVVGTVSDGAGTRRLFINGKPVNLDPQGRFSHSMRLDPGTNVIVLNALDAQGRTTESSFSVRNSDGSLQTAAGIKASQPAGFGRYHALVIGNNAYEHLPRLETAVNDAAVVSEVLRTQYGFEVTLLVDTTRDKIIRALDDMRTKLTDQDNLLIYYAGHGTLDKEAERGYWLPINAHADTRVNWLSTTEITDTLKAMTAKHVMLVADSCYSGTLLRDAGEGLRSGVDQETFYNRLAQKRSRTALTSGGLEPVLDSGGGNHSVFTKAFLTVLQENTAILEGQQLSNRIKRQVVVNSIQTPEYADIRSAGHDGGDFLFVRLP
ncbi:MAG: ankyrin repeat domain-containing protein [Candidatus Tectimicrobiota bacterium]